MNAPATAAQLAAPTLKEVAIAMLVPSKSHVQELRRARFDKKKLEELAEDVKRNGLLQHPLVRPIGDGFEIIAGERRYLAAKLAGLKSIYVNVRELTDDQALEAQLSENLQREGLHELEEAEGYEELMKLKKVNADQVAEMVGKSRSYVYARLKLTALCPEARKAFYAGELDASRALLIARIGHHDTQRQAMKDITQGVRDWGPKEPMSYREAHSHILQRYMLKLAGAPFDVKDATLVPKAGDCVKCPKRTGNQADLFGDVKNADVCTDPKCFDDKRQAHFAIARRKMEAAGRKVIHGADAKKVLPSWEHGGDHIRGEYIKLEDGDYFAGRYQKAKDILGKDYVATLLQHPLTGKFIEVAPRSTVSAKASAKTKDRQRTSGGKAQTTTRTQNSGPSKYDIDRMVIARVIQALAPKLGGTLAREDLLELGEAVMMNTSGDTTQEVLKIKNARIEKLSDKDLARFLVLQQVEDGLDTGATYADKVCKRHKIDPAKIEKEVHAELKKKAEDEKAKTAAATSGKAKAKASAKKKGKAKGKKK